MQECVAELVFTNHGLEFFGDYGRAYGLGGAESFGPAVRALANLGGYLGEYLGREYDLDRGYLIMCHGYGTQAEATPGHRMSEGVLEPRHS